MLLQRAAGASAQIQSDTQQGAPNTEPVQTAVEDVTPNASNTSETSTLSLRSVSLSSELYTVC